MATAEPITAGTRFGRWTVITELDRIFAFGQLRRRALFRCDCGTQKIIQLGFVQNGTSRSCGCARRDTTRSKAYVSPGKKLCSACKKNLSLEEFASRPERGPGAVRSRCRDCARRLSRESNIIPGVRQRRQSYRSRWIANHREDYLAGKRQWRKNWYRSNKGKSNAYAMEYIARKKRALPAWADHFLIDEIYDLCAMRNAMKTCGICWEVDHIVPLTSKYVCGLHVQDNLQVISAGLNCSKKNRYWPDMWPRA